MKYLYSTCAAFSSIRLLKSVIMACISSGLVLYLRVNPNLRDFFSEFSITLLGCGIMQKTLLLQYMKSPGGSNR